MPGNRRIDATGHRSGPVVGRESTRHPRLVAIAACWLFAAGLLGGAADAAYEHPVDAPVSARFDEPAHPYAPGNRGQEYAVSPGAPIRAVGSGVVVFAGWVAGAQYVTVLHPDGLRSSYSPVRAPTVIRGERVRAGQTIGVAADRFQLGIRRGSIYLDPAGFIEDAVVHAVLIDR